MCIQAGEGEMNAHRLCDRLLAQGRERWEESLIFFIFYPIWYSKGEPADCLSGTMDEIRV